jgi:hemerythrin-like domain-containing protein
MNFQKQVSQALDDEHRTNLELLGRVEQAFARANAPNAARDPALAALAQTLGRHLRHDIGRHFDFEERDLFPLLEQAGEGDIAALLKEEHDAIRAVATEMLPLVDRAGDGVLDDGGLRALKRGVLELVERQVAHIQKESMALLPMLDDVLDESMDSTLAMAYASG